MKRKKLRLYWNVMLAVMVFVVWILSFFFWREGAVSANGWTDLKFFTVESNLLVGVVAIIYLVWRFAKGEEIPFWLSFLKYLSVSMVTVTFLVVLLFLGPVHGFGIVYYGSNLFFHLTIPVLAILETVFLEEEEITFKESFFAMAPPAVYGIGYLSNILINGAAENDWYYFLNWGYDVGIAVFFVICLLAWGSGMGLRALKKAAGKISWEDKNE